MKVWEPDQHAVKQTEFVGRRLFGKNTDTSAPDSPNLFLDTRLHEDLSLDRLGDGHINASAVIKLTPLCHEAAAQQTKAFFGWAAVQRKHFKYEQIRPDPLNHERDGVENPFHALLDRSAARERSQAFHLSRSLYMTFKEHGSQVEPAKSAPT